MIESNIGIASNIYIRKDPDISKDTEYLNKVSGAKRLCDIQRRYYSNYCAQFSEVQRKIASETVPCALAKNGEMSFGAIKSEQGLSWVNRCEYTECPRYETCTFDRIPKHIIHESVPEEDNEDKKSIQEFFETLGIIIKDDDVVFERDRNTAKTEESDKEYNPPKEQPVEELKQSSKNYVEITESDCIISAPLDSHIILNSGPGTGKTYTIIQRLIYILANNLCPADEIYILCYTRSAKKVIENKIEQAVTDGIIQPSAKNICILTFDSYATYFLIAMKDQGVITENFESCNYNDRIKLFNKYISEEDFEGISYFIVDEIQDLVNERAEMVLKILGNLKCGYLLAGDRCQSIYDYEADDSATIDSVEFYKRAEKQFPADMLRYEITVNRRQSAELAEEAANMREVLLNKSFTDQNRYASRVVLKYLDNRKIEAYIKSLDNEPTVPTAILCRNNGEAEYISALLCEKGIIHSLNRGVNNVAPLSRWIADVFWDYCRETISQKDFLERFTFRCSSDADPNLLWDILCKLTDSQDKSVINVTKLITALTVSNNIPDEFYEKTPALTVSTIHKAKGSEFEKVILIKSDIKPTAESAEEARVRYVAITRPKSELTAMKMNSRYFNRTASGRIIETGLHNIYKTHNRYCKCITVGLTGDIDNTSFVSGDFKSILGLQEYIVSNIKLYDKLSAKRSANTGIYEIYHNGRCIGALSKNMINEIDMGVTATDYKNNLPNSLENLYVSGITTEILRRFNANVPIEYQKSRICFGVQITGLAKLVFEKKG